MPVTAFNNDGLLAATTLQSVANSLNHLIIINIKISIRNSIGLLGLTICCASCRQYEKSLHVYQTLNAIVIDSAAAPNQFLQYNTQFDYPIYFIGPKQDTIRIGKRYWRGVTEWKNDFEVPQTENYSAKNLDVFVDTSIHTNSPVEYFSDNQQTARDSTLNFNAYLVLINNLADSAIYLGHTFSLFYISREAKDRKGNWVKIDKKLNEPGICGTGEPFIILKPHEVLVSKVKRYKGSMVTDFRLAFGYKNNVVYSNTFRDSIDERTIQQQHPE